MDQGGRKNWEMPSSWYRYEDAISQQNCFPPSPRRKPCDDGGSGAIVILFRLYIYMWEKNVLIAVWLVTGAFVTEHRSDLRLRLFLCSQFFSLPAIPQVHVAEWHDVTDGAVGANSGPGVRISGHTWQHIQGNKALMWAYIQTL